MSFQVQFLPKHAEPMPGLSILSALWLAIFEPLIDVIFRRESQSRLSTNDLKPPTRNGVKRERS
jgi:hypothetical protein